MNCLVTGASGFLGRCIVRHLLDAGVDVRALLRSPGTQLEDGVEACAGDLADEDAVTAAVQGMDWVVHAGARVETTGSWEEFAEVNIRGTLRVIRAARSAGVQRIVHISSLSVYSVPRDGVTISEEDPYESETNARGFYSRSKLAADRLALSEARAGAPVVVLRPGLLYGPGRRPPLARQSRRLGRYDLLLARPDYLLPLAFVDNVADAVLLAARAPNTVGKAFTIVDESIPQGEYLRLYQEAAGVVLHPVYLPVRAIGSAARVAEKGLRALRRRSPITYHQVRRATDSAVFDCSRAHDLLRWTPAVSVREGLRRTFSAEPPEWDSGRAPTIGESTS